MALPHDGPSRLLATIKAIAVNRTGLVSEIRRSYMIGLNDLPQDQPVPDKDLEGMIELLKSSAPVLYREHADFIASVPRLPHNWREIREAYFATMSDVDVPVVKGTEGAITRESLRHVSNPDQILNLLAQQIEYEKTNSLGSTTPIPHIIKRYCVLLGIKEDDERAVALYEKVWTELPTYYYFDRARRSSAASYKEWCSISAMRKETQRTKEAEERAAKNRREIERKERHVERLKAQQERSQQWHDSR